jgi:hypothetical protein
MIKLEVITYITPFGTYSLMLTELPSTGDQKLEVLSASPVICIADKLLLCITK